MKRRLKDKACKQCKELYTPRVMGQQVCSINCALVQAKDKSRKEAVKEDKAFSAETRRRKLAIKTQPKWLKEAQQAFNRYIRARDKGKPCISCGVEYSEGIFGSKFDCGHYRSTGAASHLRFNTHNAAGQCVRCNRDLSGNAVMYRQGLIIRIGQEKVEALENDNSVVRYDIDRLKRIKALFNQKALKLEKQQ